MNFTLSDEQQALRDAARSFFGDRWSARPVLAALDRPPVTLPDDVWAEIAGLGLIGLALPEEVGGGGADLVTAAVLVEEAARALVPGPLLSSVVAGIAIDRSGADSVRKRILPELCAGRLKAALAVQEPARSWRADAATVAERNGDGLVLNGSKILVPDAAGAGLLLVAGRTDDGEALFLVPPDAPGVTVTPMNRIDGQSIAEVRLEKVRVSPDDALDAPGLIESARDVWAALCAADLLGLADQVRELTTTYAKDRVQFGRPIGAFQAVSHRLVDAFVDVEIGRGLVYGACLALDEGRPEAGALASGAKAWMSDAACRITETAVQLHGGIGYTWELDLHLFLRRARANAATAGTADEHRDRIARWMQPDEEA